MPPPPAYRTRERDNVYLPERQTFLDAFHVLNLPLLSSKTKETAFQILNRNIWTNSKAFKSGLADSPTCHRCEEVETMEHLLYLCPNYSARLWIEFGHTFTETLRNFTGNYVARIEFTPKEIIYNKPHPTIGVQLTERQVRIGVLTLVQEIKRDIIYRRMQLTQPQKMEVPLICIQAHILSTTHSST
jgi:hypothetical protein